MDHSESRELIDALQSLSGQDGQGDRVSGVVTEVSADGTVWVRLAGATSSTPCIQAAALSKPGDSVSVVVRGGRAIIEGNYSSPASDDTLAKEAISNVSTARKTALVAKALASGAVGAATSSKILASKAQESAQKAAAAVEPILEDLEAIKGEEETFIAGLEKKVSDMTAEFVSAEQLAAIEKEFETSITQTAERIEMIATSETSLQLSEEAQKDLENARAGLEAARASLELARASYDEALDNYNSLLLSDDATDAQIAEAAAALEEANSSLELAQRAYDNFAKIISGIKTNYASKTELDLMAEGLKLLFSNEDEDYNSYVKITGEGMRLGDIESNDSYLNVAKDEIAFVQGGQKVATIEEDKMKITRAELSDELKINNWRWKQRENGNISFKWRRG